ncbi:MULTISPECIES: trypsin-like serine protease [Micrococcus]|uniref:Trypsin-like serine protease n=1 Tax=Micrococcus lylae TaxID=1273 RepID=A0ABY2K590_9MICC|nr:MULTISPECIES: trypsin-like serine protease [Micrococcus]OFR87750.1 hypothetical protein HMPREF2863_02380 [Micrococcus sp. HMSC067E09]TFI00436.1 trypsin-like serine protease [Micrococcus lylae]WIK83284.1 trypsin-like serine protease [Micrococcus lylae]
MKKFAVSSVAGVIAAVTLSAGPAYALQSTTFAEDTEEAKPVVSVRVDDSDPDDGVCTGTAIDPHWVITARHCVDAAAKPGGSVRIGQGDQQQVYQVDRHEIAPRGDIALLHTEQEMALEQFAEVADEVPTGDVNIYGWSSDGSGGSTKLPSARAEIRGESPLALFDAPKALEVALKGGARIQPGDSGGAIFADGKVAAIMSAGLFEDPDNPTEEEMTSNAAVAVAPVADQFDWIRGVIGGTDATETGEASEQGDAAAEAPSEGSAGIWGTVGIGAGVVVLAAAGVWLLLRRRAA